MPSAERRSLDGFIDALADALAARLTPADGTGDRSPWLTTEEAAERLRCSVDTIKAARTSGRLKAHRIGRRCLHHVADVDALPEGA